MVCCAYCGEPASLKIVANPEQVCQAHAVEFWCGLLDYVRDHSTPCVKHEGSCTCRACDELNVAYVRARAIAAAGPAPLDDDQFQIRLAS
ncbi:MAG: hypothetical protein ABI868_23430 [Acidobacteriota bacterium]